MIVLKEYMPILTEFFDSNGIPYKIGKEHSDGRVHLGINYDCLVFMYDLLYYYTDAIKNVDEPDKLIDDDWKPILPFLFRPLEEFLIFIFLHGVDINQMEITELEDSYNRFHKCIAN